MDKMLSGCKTRILYICSIFLFCGLIGWIFETAEIAIVKHTFTNRGFLFVLEPLPHYFPELMNVPVLKSIPLIIGLPLIEVYGIGGIVTILGLRKLKDRPVLLFLAGMSLLTVLELLGSYFCTFVLHKKFWDYSGRFLNFQGRICLTSSLAWGVGAVLALKLFSPIIRRLYGNVKARRGFQIWVSVLMAMTLLCALSKYWWFSDILSKQA